MREKDMQTIFTRWVSKNRPAFSTAWELKITKVGRLPFSAVADHQKINLLKVVNLGKYYKIPDMASTDGFTSTKPFDCFLIKGEAYVVAWFYKPRARREFIFIDIITFLNEEKTSTRKSLTEARAKELGTIYDMSGV